jgi:hypothetical protein
MDLVKIWSIHNFCKWPTWHTVVFSYMFIPNLYMFRANMCSSSGELIVSIRHPAYVTVFIPNLYMFRAIMCSSSGELIVSIRHPVYDHSVFIPPNLYMFQAIICSSSGKLTVSIRHLVYVILRRWHIPDVELIQLILLMISTWVLETCRDLE